MGVATALRTKYRARAKLEHSLAELEFCLAEPSSAGAEMRIKKRRLESIE